MKRGLNLLFGTEAYTARPLSLDEYCMANGVCVEMSFTPEENLPYAAEVQHWLSNRLNNKISR